MKTETILLKIIGILFVLIGFILLILNYNSGTCPKEGICIVALSILLCFIIGVIFLWIELEVKK